MEDLDALAGTIAYRHCDDGNAHTRPLTIVTSEDLALVHPPVADCERYDQLRGLHAAA